MLLIQQFTLTPFNLTMTPHHAFLLFREDFSFHFTPLQTWQATPYIGLSTLKLSFYKNRLGVERENQSQWTRSQPFNRGLQSPVKHLSCSRRGSRTKRKARPGANPSPSSSVSHTGLPQVVEHEADELMQASPLLSHFLYSFLSCGLKNILGLSFSCQYTCCHYFLLLQSLYESGLWEVQEGPASSVLHKHVKH